MNVSANQYSIYAMEKYLKLRFLKTEANERRNFLWV